MNRARKTAKEAYYYVGGMLRDELVSSIDSLKWEGEDKERAAKIKSSLQRAAPHREDLDFLKSILVDIVEEDFGHMASSRGFAVGNTPFGRQIRALREKL